MARVDCKKCGASMNSVFYMCPQCGTKRPDNELLKSVDIAYNADNSDAARRFYNSILANDPINAQAYWGLFLLDYGVKDCIFDEGLAKVRVTAENYLLKKFTEKLYDSINSNENYRQALSLAEGEFKKRVDRFWNGLEERLAELERNKPTRTPSYEKTDNSDFDTEVPPKKASGISAGKLVATIFCCVPVILELLFVLLIPKIGVLAKNAYVSRWGWPALPVPMKVAFLSVIVLGFVIQILGLFGKLHKVLGMFTQIISFALFLLSVYAVRGNASSVFTLWGLAMIVPASLLVATLRYVSADSFGFIDDFNFWYYLPIALEVAEYILFFLVFPSIFGVTASLWFFVAITVTTVASIAVSSFWEDFHWAPVGINIAVAVLLCVIFWIGRLISSEWFWNGGVITVVILAIGGSWFIHWFIHRNDV